MRLNVIILFLAPVLVLAQQFNPETFRQRSVQAIRLKQPLDIDGQLNESIYGKRAYTDFVQFQPLNGRPCSQKTDVWIGYDEHALYVGARMWDTHPDSIETRVGRRDEWLNTELFEIIIDSYHDKRTGYSFQINPSGAIRDESYYNDSWTDGSWDGIWEGRSQVDDGGWTTEMRIPFSQLRFSEKRNYTWGVILTRYLPRRDEWDYFVYIPREESGIISRAAKLTGIEGIKPPARQSILPYVTAGYSNLPTLNDNHYYQGQDTKLGLGADIQFGIGGNLTVDATINPDFGQVEVDPSRINLSAYETYYQEKRPFFIEGRNVFRFGANGPTNNMSINASTPDFFYSRRIGRSPQGYVDVDDDSIRTPDVTRILGAAKLSGKLENGLSVGGFSALTNREYATYIENGIEKETQVEPHTSYNLLRARKDINDGRQGIGVIMTHVARDFNGMELLGDPDEDHTLADDLNRSATALGIDSWTFLGDNRDWAVGAWFGVSDVRGTKSRLLTLQESSRHYFQRPDVSHVSVDSSLTSLQGHAGRIRLNRETGSLIFNMAMGWVSPGFETNDMGLTWSTDRINNHVIFGYNLHEPRGPFQGGRIDLGYAVNHEFGGRISDQVLLGMGWVQFSNYWSFDFFAAWNPETNNPTALWGGPNVRNPSAKSMNIGLGGDSRKDLTWRVGYSGGNSADGSYNYSADVYFTLKLGERLNVQTGPVFNYSLDKTQYVTDVEDAAHTAMYGRRYVVATLEQHSAMANIRLNYTFSPRLTLQSYFQPFLATGAYREYKEYRRPDSRDLLVYGEEGTSIQLNNDDEYEIDPTGGTDEDAFTVSNPDFNFKALVGTMVLRWEFSPGSTLYLVWTHNGYNSDHPGDFNLSRDLSDLLKSDADDVFALKISYWLGR